jgi:hypothetical protein
MRARDNPFSTDRVLAVRFEPQDMAWPDLWNRIVRMNYRGAIVGLEGSGKTTLLEDLSPRLRETGCVPLPLRLDRENRAFTREQLDTIFKRDLSNSVVLFDGAEQLGRLAWRRFLSNTKSARGLIITSHRAGLLPTIIEARTSPELLGRIVERLLQGFGALSSDEISQLWHCHRGNVREALRELYDRYSLVPL